jgi:protein ImuB
VQGRTIIVCFSERIAGELYSSVVSELGRITAHCEIDGDHTFLFPVKGPARYFGGEKALAYHVHSVMQSLVVHVESSPRTAPSTAIECGVGVGDSRFVANLAALESLHTRNPMVVFARDTSPVLRSLPVHVLAKHAHIDIGIVEVFQHLGLHTLGHIADLGETALVDRFGSIGKDVFLLSTGKDIELFSPSVGGFSFSVTCDFDNLTHHGLSEAMNDSRIVVSMAQDSIQQFDQLVLSQGFQCLCLRIRCETEHGEHNEKIWSDTRGFHTSDISERLQWQLDHWFSSAQINEQFTSCISIVVFEALQCRKISAESVTLWDVRDDNTERVVRALARAAVVDEQAFFSVPVWKGGRDVSTYGLIDVSLIDLHARNESCDKNSEWNGSIPSPRPLTLCDPGIMVSLQDALSRPIYVTGRHELSAAPTKVCFPNGATWRVLSWAGPWPIEERWWDPHRCRRHARMQVLAESRGNTIAWMLSVESRQWKITGIYH